MYSALEKVPDSKLGEAKQQAGVGFFFYHTLKTMLHIKRWWLLNKKLEIEYDFQKANELLDKMTEIIESEFKNVSETMPLVEGDSLLGWEPSIDYCCDPAHLEWKIRQLTNLREHTLPAYRKTICRHPLQ